MAETTLIDIAGRKLTLGTDRQPDSDGVWAYRATLAVPEGTVTTDVWDIGNGLATFVREVADAWQGFEGTKEFSSLEGQLELSCQHDGVGTVVCIVRLRRPQPPEWRFEAVLQLGAGAQLDEFASEIEALSWNA
ncbi:MAG: DUF6228 family protein [Acidimicrobiales bacterium]